MEITTIGTIGISSLVCGMVLALAAWAAPVVCGVYTPLTLA